MTAATATFDDVAPLEGRAFVAGFRRLIHGIAFGLGGVAAAGLLAIACTLAAAWIVTAAISSNPNGPTKASIGTRTFAGTRFVTIAGDADHRVPALTDRTSDLTLEARLARARMLASELMAAMPAARLQPLALASAAPASIQPPAPVRANSVPLPQPNPARHDAAPAEQSTQQIAAFTPPPAPTAPKAAAPPQPHATLKALPDLDSRTAVYDISARTVYLPNGKRLEAHSGLGEKMDDPRYKHVRMRGPTPPNVYTLTMREKLFHGVRAIRLNPVDEGKMFGRDGMLAHSYMLGPNGQSNGCVSFKDYGKFLQAFLAGEVERLVVVERLNGTPPSHVARSGGRTGGRYASNEQFDRTSAQAW